MALSSKLILDLVKEYYLAPLRAKAAGRPVAFVSAFAPIEILEAAGVVCVYPESYAAVCSAYGSGAKLIESSSAFEFSQDLCSYYSISSYGSIADRLPYGGLPKPDLLVGTNNQCGTILPWFAQLASGGTPYFLVDYPGAAADPELAGKYIEAQHKALAAFVERHTGRQAVPEKLGELVAASRRSCEAWARLHEPGPGGSPALAVDKIINAIFPVVVRRTAPATAEYYSLLLKENSPVPAGKKKRLLWHGYPLWYLKKKVPALSGEAEIVLNDYTLWWALDYCRENGFSALARAYKETYLNRGLAARCETLKALVKKYAIDGVVLSANRSCRRSAVDVLPLKRALDAAGIPSVTVETDMADPRSYAEEQVGLRLEAFLEGLR